MEIAEFANILGLKLEVFYRGFDRSKKLKPFYCHFHSVDEKDDCIFIGHFGDGDTMLEAVKDYCNQIKGKQLVYNATEKEHRKEFVAPDNLECNYL
jgi:hypothetical protein